MKRFLLSAAALAAFAGPAVAVEIRWTDWQSSSNANGFTATGVIVSASETITVTYTNPLGGLVLQLRRNQGNRLLAERAQRPERRYVSLHLGWR